MRQWGPRGAAFGGPEAPGTRPAGGQVLQAPVRALCPVGSPGAGAGVCTFGCALSRGGGSSGTDKSCTAVVMQHKAVVTL